MSPPIKGEGPSEEQDVPRKIPLTKEQAITLYEGVSIVSNIVFHATNVLMAAYTATSETGRKAERATDVVCNSYASAVEMLASDLLTPHECHTHPRIVEADRRKDSPFQYPERSTPNRAPHRMSWEMHGQLGAALSEVQDWMTSTFVILSKSYAQTNSIFSIWRKAEKAVRELRNHMDDVVSEYQGKYSDQELNRVYLGGFPREKVRTIPLAIAA